MFLGTDKNGRELYVGDKVRIEIPESDERTLENNGLVGIVSDLPGEVKATAETYDGLSGLVFVEITPVEGHSWTFPENFPEFIKEMVDVNGPQAWDIKEVVKIDEEVH